MGIKKLPTIAQLNGEYAALLAEKKGMYWEYRKTRAEMREVVVARQKAAKLLGVDAPSETKPAPNQQR